MSLRKNLIRASFSFLAASVCLAMAQEWAGWAIRRREWWRLVPAYVLATLAMVEARFVWRRGERIFGLK